MLILLITALLAGFAATDPLVTNKNTKISYEGTSSDGVEQFQNIRFAEDTKGPNRFTPPKPHLPSPGSKVTATERGAACPQATKGAVPPMTDVSKQSEDCLNLRIARPADSKLYKKPLPVMVYIYGGGSILGEAYDGFFNPVGLVRQSIENEEPIVYVAMNYRVGVFGFAAAKVLQENKAENLGLRDQHLALEWIRDNIAAFGGDPSRITLFGQSFGGISVGLQMVAWGGKQEKLFHKAIITSGAISADRNNAFAIKNTAAVANGVKCTDKHGVVDEAAVSCLRNAPLADLLKSNLDVATTVRPSYGFAAFSPVVDGDIIPDQPEKLLTEGKFLRGIPTIATWTADDGSLSADAGITKDTEVVDQFASSISQFSEELGHKILSLYPRSDFDDQARPYPGVSPQYFRASRIVRDLDPVCPLLTIVQQLSKYGTKDLYVGELNETRLLPYWEAWGQPWGVSHLSDIPYFFNEEIPPPGDNSDRAKALSANYSGSFISFANNGSPVGTGKKTFQAWPKVDTGALVIGGEHGTGPAETRLLGREKQPKTELKKREAGDERTVAFENEQLVDRCTYLKSLRVF